MSARLKATELASLLHPLLNSYLINPNDITPARWSPEQMFHDLDPEIRTHLDELNIPSTTNANQPSLLLHDLGRFDDKMLDESLRSVFTTRHTRLINVSGSGKTRIMLEGLLRNWGFYFVCKDDGTNVGSKDLQDTLQDMEQHPGFTDNLLPHALTGTEPTRLGTNKDIAASMLYRVLLSRLVIFNQFLHFVEARSSTPADIAFYRRKWLFLQIYPGYPQTQTNTEDMFAKCAKEFSGYPTNELVDEILCARDSVRTLLARLSAIECTTLTRMYLVIDEAQVAASSCLNAFKCGLNIQYRSSLRQLIWIWTEILNSASHLYVVFIAAGTGGRIKHLQDGTGSISFKQRSHVFVASGATGGFDEREVQEKYVRRYVPSKILDTALGIKLLDRMWYWLRGRRRLTATFLSLLLQNCFHRPHALLDSYIRLTADLEPLDYNPSSIFPEPNFPLASRVDHIIEDIVPEGSIVSIKSKENHEMRALALSAVYDFILRARRTHLSGTNADALLEFGYARIPSRETEKQIDEKIMILSLLKWANTNPRPEVPCQSLYQYAALNIEEHHPTDGTNGFEAYVALTFAMIFRNYRNLSTVFDFASGSNTGLRQRMGKLVALSAYRTPEGGIYYEEGMTEIDPRGHVLGCASGLGRARASTDPHNDFLRWLRFGYSEPFFFPSNTAASDIMFVLKLAADNENDECFIWVTVQCKLHQGEPFVPGPGDELFHHPEYTDPKILYLSHSTFDNAIKTTTPRRFGISKKDTDDGLESFGIFGEGQQYDKHYVESRQAKIQRNEILSAMQRLPKRADREVGGTFSCLRVVVSWPAITEFLRFASRRRGWVDPDQGDGHPLATLNRDAFVNSTKDIDPTSILEQVQKARRAHVLAEYDNSAPAIPGTSSGAIPESTRMQLPVEKAKPKRKVRAVTSKKPTGPGAGTKKQTTKKYNSEKESSDVKRGKKQDSAGTMAPRKSARIANYRNLHTSKGEDAMDIDN